jgi:cytoskeleton protein RodZ
MGRLNAVQVDQLKAIGADLRQKRQQAGISLEEVAVKTYIPLRILQALEAADANHLPEPIFVQGFIRRYGDLIGLNGSAISKTFSTDTEPTSVENSGKHPSSQQSSGGVARFSPTPPKSAQTPIHLTPPLALSSSQPQSVYYVLAGILGLGIIVGISSLVLPSLLSSKRSQPSLSSASKPSSPPVMVQPLATKTVAPKPTAPKPRISPPPAATQVVQANVSLKNEAWLEVIVDGTTVFEGILNAGTKRTWTAKQQIVFTSGNAGAVVAAFNGGKATIYGQPGAIKTVTVSKQGVQAN